MGGEGAGRMAPRPPTAPLTTRLQSHFQASFVLTHELQSVTLASQATRLRHGVQRGGVLFVSILNRRGGRRPAVLTQHQGRGPGEGRLGGVMEERRGVRRRTTKEGSGRVQVEIPSL